MSWHCWICGGSSEVRGKYNPTEKFVILKIIDPFGGPQYGKKLLAHGCVHASCLRKILMYGQRNYMYDDEFENFEYLKDSGKRVSEKVSSQMKEEILSGSTPQPAQKKQGDKK